MPKKKKKNETSNSGVIVVEAVSQVLPQNKKKSYIGLHLIVPFDSRQRFQHWENLDWEEFTKNPSLSLRSVLKE